MQKWSDHWVLPLYFDLKKNMSTEKRKRQKSYCLPDGACSGNPGPGGWAYILRHPETGRETSAQGSEADTTNNRMELTAAVQGLQQLKRPTCVELVTDSVYVGTGLSDWLPKWKKQGWKRKERGRLVAVKNEGFMARVGSTGSISQCYLPTCCRTFWSSRK